MKNKDDMKKECKKFFKRYHFSKGSLILSFVLISISFFGLIYFSYCLNTLSISVNSDGTINFAEYRIYSIFKDVCVVVFSALGVNLLISFCIEKAGKNSAFEDFFINDIISSPYFYSKLSHDNREKMLKAIELQHYYDNNKPIQKICNSIRDNITDELKDYYYSECSYTVRVNDKGNYFEKYITHNISLMPYNDQVTINDYVLAHITNTKINGLDIFELESVQLNGKDITKKCFSTHNNINENVGAQKDFNNETVLAYQDKITLSSKRPTSIIIKFITRCPKDDITSSFRASVPCEQFRVNYIINSQDYKLISYTFGLCETAEDSSSNKNPNEADIKFKNWIFKDDGVVITMCKK